MGAPAYTARQTPQGIRLEDGYQSLFAFAADPDVSLWEIETGLPGLDGGEPINTTTQHNVNLRTMAPRALKTMTAFTTRCAYDPQVYEDLDALINVETAITNHFPDGTRLAFWGFLQKFEPDGLVDGTFPTAQVTIVPTNTDPSDGTEANFVMDDIPGT